MDNRNPINGEIFEGERLKEDQYLANNPFPFTPMESLVIVSLCALAVFAGLWAWEVSMACKLAGV
jgi:hypothetical protein